jgi:hypothetical protein
MSRYAALVSGVLMMWVCTVHAAVYYVYPDAHLGDFPNIQAAVDSTRDGDVIMLGDGVFRGDGNRDVQCVSKEITIRSVSGDPAACMIDCEATFDEPHGAFCFRNVGTAGLLMGVGVQNGYADHGAVYVLDSSMRIERCIFADNIGVYGGAIGLGGDLGVPVIARCTFVHNWALDRGAGICI